MYRLNNIKIRANLNEKEIIAQGIKKYKINPNEVKSAYIFKRSVDARNKEDIFFNYTIDVELKKSREIKGAQEVEEYNFEVPEIKRKSEFKPIVVGAGPAGLFSALIMVQNGLKPVVIERGSKVEKRIEDVNEFVNHGKLNTKSNIQFGEGGAGTFSDGKLNTGNTSIYARKVLQEFVNFGAPKEIMYLAKPHIGTDHLVKVVRNMREYIIENGGTFLFDTQVMSLDIKDSKVCGVVLSDGKKIATDTVVLAIGHSARDTFKTLLEEGFNIIPKNFAVGVRIEHLQENINLSQYGDKTKFKLPTAEYKLVYHAKNGRSVYTFCMCPGGQVMASSSEENTVVTNGMSRFKRDGVNSNSALLVNITPEDCGDTKDPLCGMYFQENLEKKAFVMGGSNYYAPVQRVEDYMKNQKSEKIGKVIPTYAPGYTLANINELFPEYINESMKEALTELDKKLKGFADDDAMLTAVETRTSSPVQISRDRETLIANIDGVYPCGEGAGYAGGIMTAAVDGIKVSLEILKREI